MRQVVMLVAACVWVAFEVFPSSQAVNVDQTAQRVAAAVRFMAASYPDLEEEGPLLQLVARLGAGMDARQFGIQFASKDLLNIRSATDMLQAQCYGRFDFSGTDFLGYYG